MYNLIKYNIHPLKLMQIKSNNDLMIALKQIPKIEIDSLISSKYQTKDWRASQEWYINGKHNECENYQINLVEKLMAKKLEKTNDRINLEKMRIISNKNPILFNNVFEWTENFDRKFINNYNNTYYYNFKFICDKGGAQTRTLKDTYNFIKSQLEYIIKYAKLYEKYITGHIYFINILDGDASYDNMDKFIFLLNKEKYKNYKFIIDKFMFVGSLYDFKENILNYNL